MADENRLSTLEQNVDRRSFLRGSGLFAAALGLGLVSPLALLAQEKPPEKKDDKKKEGGAGNPDEDLFAEDAKAKETKLDANGREYRSCPQCGYNMYRQGRTWTCENCGYSYVE